MTRTKSSKKAHRASLKKRVFNLKRSAQIEKNLRALKLAVTPTVEQLSKVQKNIDKAVKTKTIHWRKAARLVSQAAKQLVGGKSIAQKSKPVSSKSTRSKAKGKIKKRK